VLQSCWTDRDTSFGLLSSPDLTSLVHCTVCLSPLHYHNTFILHPPPPTTPLCFTMIAVLCLPRLEFVKPVKQTRIHFDPRCTTGHHVARQSRNLSASDRQPTYTRRSACIHLRGVCLCVGVCACSVSFLWKETSIPLLFTTRCPTSCEAS